MTGDDSTLPMRTRMPRTFAVPSKRKVCAAADRERTASRGATSCQSKPWLAGLAAAMLVGDDCYRYALPRESSAGRSGQGADRESCRARACDSAASAIFGIAHGRYESTVARFGRRCTGWIKRGGPSDGRAAKLAARWLSAQSLAFTQARRRCRYARVTRGTRSSTTSKSGRRRRSRSVASPGESIRRSIRRWRDR